MELRTATYADLEKLKQMYIKIVENLEQNKIKIYWSEFYPYEEFEVDIAKKTLFVLEDENKLAGAFALTVNTDGSEKFNWQSKNASALYVCRLGVNVDYLRHGYGTLLLEHAKKIAKDLNATYLRMLVAKNNKPAIALYAKNKFKRVHGEFKEHIEHKKAILTEIGFEIKL